MLHSFPTGDVIDPAGDKEVARIIAYDHRHSAPLSAAAETLKPESSEQTADGAAAVHLIERVEVILAEMKGEISLSTGLVGRVAAEQRETQNHLHMLNEEIARVGGALNTAREIVQIAQTQGTMLIQALAQHEAQVAALTAELKHCATRSRADAERYERARIMHQKALGKLMEELEREKTDRLLAQAALSVARATREKLLAQLATAKGGSRCETIDHIEGEAAKAPGR